MDDATCTKLAELVDDLGKNERLFLLYYLMRDYASLMDECINGKGTYEDENSKIMDVLARLSAIQHKKFALDVEKVLCEELF